LSKLRPEWVLAADACSNACMKLSPAVALASLLAALAPGIQAQTQNPVHPTTAPAIAATEGKALASAKVLKVYLKESRLWLKHGPIANLGMSAMTMEFGVRDPKMLKSLKPGDDIKFTAELVKDDYVVTFIERSR